MSNTRRLFLQWLASLPLLSLLARPAIARPAPRKLLMNQFRVAGLAYYDVETAIRGMQAGDPLRLVAEPTNPHDEFAVEIWHDEYQLGYVPRSDNRHISRLLRQGATLTGEVWEADPDAPVWEMVRAKVYLID
ncbi:HIRAN domain-containing protein [Arthrospira platensis SPKY1]|nr:HIRAN domain-containing protein [Arthrospira platensis SPKY1]